MAGWIVLAVYVVGLPFAARFVGRAMRHMDVRILGHAEGLTGSDYMGVIFLSLGWPVCVPTFAVMEYGVHSGRGDGGKFDRLRGARPVIAYALGAVLLAAAFTAALALVHLLTRRVVPPPPYRQASHVHVIKDKP